MGWGGGVLSTTNIYGPLGRRGRTHRERIFWGLDFGSWIVAFRQWWWHGFIPVNRFTWRAKSRRPSKEECGHTAHTLAAALKRTHGWETRHAMKAGRYRRRRRSPTYLRTGSPVGQTRRERSFWVVTGVLSFRQPVNVASVTRDMYNGGHSAHPHARARGRHGEPNTPWNLCGTADKALTLRLFSVGEQATCRTTGGGHVGLRAQTKKGTSKRRLFEAFNQKNSATNLYRGLSSQASECL